MAKIRGFLAGAKGKVGDFVFQKGEKATIVRANNGVSNPQSAAQMAQRLAFATVTNAAKKMLSVIGLSFYGVSDGKLSRRRFVELNVPVLKAAADAYLAGESAPGGKSCWYKAKDINQVVPNPYIVSDGSLILPEQLAVSRDGDYLWLNSNEYTYASVNSGTAVIVSGYDLIQGIFGCSSGEQITLVSIMSKNGESVPYEYSGGEVVTVNGVDVPVYDWMRFTRMYAPRIVFKNSGLPGLEVLADDTAETLQPKLVAALRQCIDMDKSSAVFVDLLMGCINVGLSQGRFVFNFTSLNLTEELSSDDWLVLAAGIVISANVDGKWDFTRTQLVVAMDEDTAGGPEANNNYSGLQLGTAIYTYVGVADSTNKNFMTTGTPYDEMPVN